jgi:predicted HTH transcriptional regulator
MSDYKLENREEIVRVLTERVISNAPIRELLRVYQEAVSAAIAGLDDADVVHSIGQAGYGDILEGFNIAEPPAPEAEEAPAEGEAVPA